MFGIYEGTKPARTLVTVQYNSTLRMLNTSIKIVIQLYLLVVFIRTTNLIGRSYFVTVLCVSWKYNRNFHFDRFQISLWVFLGMVTSVQREGPWRTRERLKAILSTHLFHILKLQKPKLATINTHRNSEQLFSGL